MSLSGTWQSMPFSRVRGKDRRREGECCGSPGRHHSRRLLHCGVPPIFLADMVSMGEDFDRILEDQRVADELSPMEMQTPPKRKREVLSDQDFRLRKERTDGLIEGLRNVREQSLSPQSLSELRAKELRESKEEGERLEPKRKPVADDLEHPPTNYHRGSDDEDSDGDGEATVESSGRAGNDQTNGGGQSRLDARSQDEDPGKGDAAMDAM